MYIGVASAMKYAKSLCLLGVGVFATATAATGADCVPGPRGTTFTSFLPFARWYVPPTWRVICCCSTPGSEAFGFQDDQGGGGFGAGCRSTTTNVPTATPKRP